MDVILQVVDLYRHYVNSLAHTAHDPAVAAMLPPPTAPDAPPVSIPVGITIGLLASCVQSLGLTIQRKSHVINERQPEHEQRVEHRRP